MPESLELNPERLDGEQPTEVTVEVRGNYPNFEQKLARKKLSSPKFKKSQPLFGNCSLRASRFQNMTTRALLQHVSEACEACGQLLLELKEVVRVGADQTGGGGGRPSMY